MKKTALSPELQAAWDKIDGYAKGYGLDYYPIIFEVLDYKTLYEIAAYGGFPIRYPHWRFGMDFDQMSKGYTYGLSVIYEMVINTNPSYAYLLEGNEMVTQKMVMAHVTAHVDFFKNNMWFAPTNRKMLDEMANHASRIQRLINRHGQEQIEDFIDVCLSLDNLIDYHAPYIRRPEARTERSVSEAEEDPQAVEGLKVERSYMRNYINPPEYLEKQRQKQEEEMQQTRKFPESPQKDILLFLLNYAPLERWQHTVLEVIREEAYYFAPQGMTKIMNEGWACLAPGSLLYTDQGLLPIEDVATDRRQVQVSDGQQRQTVYDWAAFDKRDTVSIRTRRGFEVTGSTTHRLLLPSGEWQALAEVQVGDKLLLGGGDNLWAESYVPILWEPTRRLRLDDVAEQAEVNVSTVIRYRQGMRGPNSEVLAPLVEAYETDLATFGPTNRSRQEIRIPKIVDEDLGAFLGYLIGDGHISETKRVIGLTTADEAQADHFIHLVQTLFDCQISKTWDEGRWRINFYSMDAIAFLQDLGLKTGQAARLKEVPTVILRSPQSVVSAFLRAYYDCDGYAGEDNGIILVTASERLGQTVQLLLLNFGILSTRRQQQDGCWRIYTTGQSAAVFGQEIGFGLHRKQTRLQNYIDNRHWFKKEDWSDEIVAIETGQGPVYDVSVTDSHRYAAQGFINHNSYWHSRIMTEKAMTDSEVISFADHHAGVVATSPGRLNPYKMGLELLRDIEERWDKGKFGKAYEECDDIQAKRNWDQKLGLGQQKLFEVRQLYNDVTFIDEFLTPEFVAEQMLFNYRHNPHTNYYEIDSREFKAIKEKLLFQLTNFGQPFIYVEDGNYHNRGELYLRHRYEGVPLKQDYARDTMRNIQTIWTRPVHLETVINDKRQLLTFDGKEYTARKM